MNAEQFNAKYPVVHIDNHEKPGPWPNWKKIGGGGSYQLDTARERSSINELFGIAEPAIPGWGGKLK